jgi:hypothetical protein
MKADEVTLEGEAAPYESEHYLDPPKTATMALTPPPGTASLPSFFLPPPYGTLDQSLIHLPCPAPTVS